MNKVLCFILGTFVSFAYADSNVSDKLGHMSLGQIAKAAMGPVNTLTKIVEDIAIVAGIAMIVGAILQYKAHRENPSQVRLSTPIFLLILGIVLILLPFVGYLTSFHPAMIKA